MKILNKHLLLETTLHFLETDEGNFTIRYSYDPDNGEELATVWDDSGNKVPESSDNYKTILNSVRR